MTPKKNVRNQSSKTKNTQKIPPKRTVKKEKPKLNMPANIKVSIPFNKNSFESIKVQSRGNAKLQRHLDPETKLQLANEVAMLQLSKQVEVPHLPEIVTFKKRGRPQKVISDFFKKRVVRDKNNTDGTIALNVTEKTQKKAVEEKPPPTKRLVTRKRLASATKENPAKIAKVETNPHPELGDIKIKSELVPDLYNSNSVEEPTIEDPIALPSEPIVNHCQPEVKKPKPVKKRQPAKQPKPTMKQPVARKKRVRKGKQENLVMGDKSPPTATGEKSPLPAVNSQLPVVKSPPLRQRLRKLPKKEPQAEVKLPPKITPKPGIVDSRKTSISSNSVASNLSWTKDISSSDNTTTCITVSSNDFVRIDKKIPVLSLTNIDHEVKEHNVEVKESVVVNSSGTSTSGTDTSSSDSDSTDSEQTFSEQYDNSIDINSLHLSASSHPSSHLSKVQSKDMRAGYTRAAEILTKTLKKIDMDFINSIGSVNEDDNANLKEFKDKMFGILDNEFGIITHCRRLREILDPPSTEKIIEGTHVPEVVEEANDVNVTQNNVTQNIVTQNDVTQNNPVEEPNKEVEFVKPISRPYRKLSVLSDGEISTVSSIVARPESPEDEPVGNTTNNSYYDNHEDDDALSLFAESITGFESLRMFPSVSSVSHARPVEEYVPKALKDTSNVEKQSYCPTKINEAAEIIASKITNICEKQNADSTSIYKQSNSTDDAESYQDFNEQNDLDTRIGPTETIKPRLMESYLEALPKTRSVVFNNLCFYNLMNGCRKYYGVCRFLHIIPSIEQIKAKLGKLDERMLVQEYLLLRNWPDLRRKYGMCYVEECSNRGLTRILVEMAYDFIVKARNDNEEDTKLRVDTIETTLMHLNNVDLSICEDLLKLCIRSDHVSKTLLCDVLMATMSITQNFSRFKSVFLNLTYFMVDNDRTFHKDVLEHILERVCILPFEEAVARALIQMMRLTSPEIFKNSMIGHFEKQISVNKNVFEEYSLLKNQCEFKSLLASAVMAPCPQLKTDQALSIRPEGGDGQPPAPSPDTTNLDNLNKTAEDPMQPVITRTIGMNPPIVFNRGPLSPGGQKPGTYRGQTSSESANSEEIVQVNVKKWRNRSIFPHLKAARNMYGDRAMHAPVRTPLRPPICGHPRPGQRLPFNRRLVTFRSPNNYVSRLPGPKY